MKHTFVSILLGLQQKIFHTIQLIIVMVLLYYCTKVDPFLSTDKVHKPSDSKSEVYFPILHRCFALPISNVYCAPRMI
jgi:hypothetical protein